MLQVVPAIGTQLFATTPPSVSNTRLIAAGWLSNNAAIYVALLLVVAGLLGLNTFLVLDATMSALADAGLTLDSLKQNRVEVVIGRGNYFNRGNLTRLQHGRMIDQTLAILGALRPDLSHADVAAAHARGTARLHGLDRGRTSPEWLITCGTQQQ